MLLTQFSRKDKPEPVTPPEGAVRDGDDIRAWHTVLAQVVPSFSVTEIDYVNVYQPRAAHKVTASIGVTFTVEEV